MRKIKKLCYVLSIVVALVLFVPPMHAQATDWTTYTVHVTKTGSKYHMAGCSYLKSDISMNIISAVNAGYTPCSRCNPPYPDLTTSYNDNSTDVIANSTNNGYSTTEGITFAIYYDSNGVPIQDTIYRGYYANWTAEYYRRTLYQEFDNLILYAATDCINMEYWEQNDINIYLSLSDLDRVDFMNYELILTYDSIYSLMEKDLPIFDWNYYVALYPEKLQEYDNNVFSLWANFLIRETPLGVQGSPTFNVYTYMNNNPDLVAIYGNDLSEYYSHYIKSGQYEGRVAY